jgi:uncharacterized protein YndB with AHSA1/START domain
MTVPRPRVQVRRELAAPPARVFGAFSDPALVARWLTPSSDVKLTVLDFDFRVGGSYRFAYDVPTGMRMIVGGTYRTIEAPTSIVFTWLIEPPDEHAGIESQVTISITPSAAGAVLVIHHDDFGRADAEARHEEGWGGALDQLAAILAADGRQP